MKFKLFNQTNNVFKIIVLIIAAYILFSLVKSIFSNYKINTQINGANKQISDLVEENSIIKNQNLYYQTNTYHEIQARKKMGLKKAGETMIIAPGNRDNKTTNEPNTVINDQTNSNTTELPNYEKWAKYIFE